MPFFVRSSVFLGNARLLAVQRALGGVDGADGALVVHAGGADDGDDALGLAAPIGAGHDRKLTASTGIDALAHAVESYTGTLTNGFIHFYAEKIMDTIAEYLPQAVEDGSNMVAREKMAVAAAQAGFLLIYGHTHAGHSIGQTVGGYFDIPHGTACA